MIAMIDAQRKGKKPPKPAPKSKENVVDLASMLRKSLAKESKFQTETRRVLC
ncbi:hypothetical protein [Mesorhizobium sp.]|uniref:hypothetical protein n=1 Tax=Mesorhizobium sp. TaxID=1871066 RepID=UPI0025C27223|nr:hypothetical protein [Mesorhizobium sp.]